MSVVLTRKHVFAGFHHPYIIPLQTSCVLDRAQRDPLLVLLRYPVKGDAVQEPAETFPKGLVLTPQKSFSATVCPEKRIAMDRYVVFAFPEPYIG